MIPVDLSANCEDWIYDPNGSWIQILGIRSRDPRTCLLITHHGLHSYRPVVVIGSVGPLW